MAREIRVSPDGDAIALRRDQPEDAWDAWAIMHAQHGGHFGRVLEVADWPVLSGEQIPN